MLIIWKSKIYISYIDSFLPSIFIAHGIIDSCIDNINLNALDIHRFVNIGSEISYLKNKSKNGKEEWVKAEVLEIIDNLKDENENKDTYTKLKLRIKDGRNSYYDTILPKKIWKEKLKLSNRYKNTAGSIIKYYEHIGNYFCDNYGEDINEYLIKTSNYILNIVSRGYKDFFNQFNLDYEFKNDKGKFDIKDVIYLSDFKNSYSNCNVIKSNNSETNTNFEIPTIFIDDNNIMNMSEFKSNKNIFLSNRMKSNVVNQDIVKNKILETTLKNYNFNNEKINKYFQTHNITIPRGVEVYAF